MPKRTKQSKTPPQQHKSPEQLKMEAEQRVEANRQRRLVSEKVYPFLLKHGKSIKATTTFLTVAKMAVQQAFANQKRMQTVDELKVIDGVKSDAPDAEAYKAFLEIFRYEKILVAEQLIEGIGNAMDSFITEELTKREIASLKTDFLPVSDEITPEGTKTDGSVS